MEPTKNQVPGTTAVVHMCDAVLEVCYTSCIQTNVCCNCASYSRSSKSHITLDGLVRLSWLTVQRRQHHPTSHITVSRVLDKEVVTFAAARMHSWLHPLPALNAPLLVTA
jgi:hypothetical protein